MTINGVAGADQDVIVGFKNKPGPSEEALIHSHGGIAKKSFHLISAIAAKIPEGEIEKMKKDKRVVYIEYDKTFKTSDEYTSSWGVQRINSDIVHNQGITGTGVKIAILDTGIDYTHGDLNGNYKGGYDFVFNDEDPMDDSTGELINSHGTHVAGIIAAEKNGIGVVGVAPDAELYAVKVLNGGGSGLGSWIISGLQWSVDNNMDIVTMSIQGYTDMQSVHDAVDNAYNRGLLVIAAGGNTNGGIVTYPAAYDSVIAVTATDFANQRASFAPIGPEIELAAPGVNIYSTIIGGGYGIRSGTSMAAPHVTGVAALILSSGFKDVNSDGMLDNKDVRELLHDANDLGGLGRDSTYGYGIVDAQRSVLGIINIGLTATNPPNKQRVLLWKGSYLVTIHSNDISKLNMEVYKDGVIQKDLSSKYKFNKSDADINLEMNVENTIEIVFTSHGNKGSTGYVTISRL